VVTVREAAVAVLVTTTVAPATTAPAESRTIPETPPTAAFCAEAGMAAKTMSSAAAAKASRR